MKAKKMSGKITAEKKDARLTSERAQDEAKASRQTARCAIKGDDSS